MEGLSFDNIYGEAEIDNLFVTIGRYALPIDRLQIEISPQGFQRVEMRLPVTSVQASPAQDHANLRGVCVHIQIQLVVFDSKDSRNRGGKNQKRDDFIQRLREEADQKPSDDNEQVISDLRAEYPIQLVSQSHSDWSPLSSLPVIWRVEP